MTRPSGYGPLFGVVTDGRGPLRVNLRNGSLERQPFSGSATGGRRSLGPEWLRVGNQSHEPTAAELAAVDCKEGSSGKVCGASNFGGYKFSS
jgi:hypothetical protein